jgi:hypothetical protein
MNRRFARVTVAVAAVSCGANLLRLEAQDAPGNSPRYFASNGQGTALTINVNGGPVVDTNNPFFQSLGTNGRACVHCHQPNDNMTITPADVVKRFETTDGTDPIFRTNDGSNSPDADVSTVDARRVAYSMLLTKGVIRIGIGIPANAEFALASVGDPYGHASAAELSLFRRPLPATNLGFLTTVMWDGRELVSGTIPGGPGPIGSSNFTQALNFDLAHQSNSATLGHAQAVAPGLTADQENAIVAFEKSLFTAQVFDNSAHQLTAAGANGGPTALSQQGFYFGINDVLGQDPTGASFNNVAMTLYDAWQGLSGGVNDARAAIARGQVLFNSRPINIVGVAGLNDDLHLTSIPGNCTSCHDTPNVGNHSVPAPLDIGIADPPTASGRTANGLYVSDMPVYTLAYTGTDPAHVGETKVVTDPGRALITGKWKDVGRFKGPILRGLAGRAPYFHNGSAPSLGDVVNFYNSRFGLGLTDQEKSDLVAFLGAL